MLKCEQCHPYLNFIVLAEHLVDIGAGDKWHLDAQNPWFVNKYYSLPLTQQAEKVANGFLRFCVTPMVQP